ncbi:hypothetical protein B0T26DRAFT_702735 [Lasiosphaeria miniovina]|uniref:Secreted protein n=1 Tax=Lasiosphaeria miniovina TaxID=1954250 RepID=A0AA40E2D7_9PEZI|nr:uncharacterized protein B0T26DRAFT_702735 [Lasiosphaeria miniovina]KAK0722452.1 hypothetical protein B0T26DRAFT_702735 [Lasiosphaeria miniovina]
MICLTAAAMSSSCLVCALCRDARLFIVNRCRPSNPYKYDDRLDLVDRSISDPIPHVTPSFQSWHTLSPCFQAHSDLINRRQAPSSQPCRPPQILSSRAPLTRSRSPASTRRAMPN